MKPTLQQKLNIDYPIFQAPMAGGIVSADFVAQLSAFGIFGSIPSGYLSLAQTREFVARVQDRTDKPFSLNLFVDYAVYGDTPIPKPEEIIAIEQTLEKGGSAFFRLATHPAIPSMDELVQLAIDCAVPALSTTFGLLSFAHIQALKLNKIQIMTTINSVYEMKLALKLQKPDVLIYQNAQAGGHKGGFTSLPHSDEADILKALGRHRDGCGVYDGHDADVYCVLAGAIVTKEDIARALEQGFDGVQIGTGFLATQDSGANNAYKDAILRHGKTAFTSSITGKKGRGLKNHLAGLKVKNNLGFPYMHYATANLRKVAKARGNTDYQSLWCGAGIAKINTLPTLQDYMESLVS